MLSKCAEFGINATQKRILSMLSKGMKRGDIQKSLKMSDLSYDHYLYKARINTDCKTTIELIYQAAKNNII